MQSHLPLHKVIWEHSPRKHNFPNSQGHHAQNTSQKLPQTKDLIFSHFPCSATQVLQIRKLDSKGSMYAEMRKKEAKFKPRKWSKLNTL